MLFGRISYKRIIPLASAMLFAPFLVSAQFGMDFSLGRSLEMVFGRNGLGGILSSRYGLYGATLIFYYLLFYGAFTAMAKKVKIFEGEGGFKLNTSGKLISHAFTGLAVLFIFSKVDPARGNVFSILAPLGWYGQLVLLIVMVLFIKKAFGDSGIGNRWVIWGLSLLAAGLLGYVLGSYVAEGSSGVGTAAASVGRSFMNLLAWCIALGVIFLIFGIVGSYRGKHMSGSSIDRSMRRADRYDQKAAKRMARDQRNAFDDENKAYNFLKDSREKLNEAMMKDYEFTKYVKAFEHHKTKEERSDSINQMESILNSEDDILNDAETDFKSMKEWLNLEIKEEKKSEWIEKKDVEKLYHVLKFEEHYNPNIAHKLHKELHEDGRLKHLQDSIRKHIKYMRHLDNKADKKIENIRQKDNKIRQYLEKLKHKPDSIKHFRDSMIHRYKEKHHSYKNLVDAVKALKESHEKIKEEFSGVYTELHRLHKVEVNAREEEKHEENSV